MRFDDSRAEDKQYELESVECVAGAKMTMCIQPTGLFRCDLLELLTTVPGFFVLDIQIGKISQILNQKKKPQIAAEIFAPVPPGANPVRLMFDTCHPMLLITLELLNKSNVAGRVTMKLKGRQQEISK